MREWSLRSPRDAKYMTFWKKKACRQPRLIEVSDTPLFGSRLSPLCGTVSPCRSARTSEPCAQLFGGYGSLLMAALLGSFSAQKLLADQAKNTDSK